MSDLFDQRGTNEEEMPSARFDLDDSVMPIGPQRVTIGRWTMERYVTLTRWPVLVTAAIVAALLYVGLSPATTWGIELLLFVFLGWMAGSRDAGHRESLTTGIIAGFGLGLLVSIVRLLLAAELIYVINVIAETMLTALIGGLVTTSITIIKKLLFRST